VIKVENLVKNYGDHVVLDHLSFTVQPGQIYGFLGPNGAGKSTTMNILTGYIGMTDGSVVINGHDLLEEPEAVRRSIGYLPEQPPLYTDMTPKEYLTFAAELKKLPKAERADSVKEVMELTQLTSMQNRLIRNLSKGYRQRVGLAQAILGFPEVIILDEPTVGLDPRQIIDIRNLIRSLAGKHTVILSSHILSEVQEICDHILILHHGKLVADGTPEELERSLRDNAIEVTLKSHSEGTVCGLLNGVEGIRSSEISFLDSECHAVIYPEEGADPREALFHACAAADVPLLAMGYRTAGLEQVFLKLISDDGNALAVKPAGGTDESGAAENTPDETGNIDPYSVDEEQDNSQWSAEDTEDTDAPAFDTEAEEIVFEEEGED